jgi:hypothetical protein
MKIQVLDSAPGARPLIDFLLILSILACLAGMIAIVA